jgi:hypothetical protein
MAATCPSATDEVEIAITPSAVTVVIGSAIQFCATGGTGGPYTFSFAADSDNGSGASLSTNGLYMAGSAWPATDIITLSDTNGDGPVSAVVEVVGPLTVVPATATVAAGGTLTFTAIGGDQYANQGVSWSVASTTGGTINSTTGVYVAGVTAGATDSIAAVDDIGNTASAQIYVVGGSAATPYATIPLTGCSFPTYTMQAIIGNQTFQMLLDTGSSTTAVAGDQCDSTCNYLDPLYCPDCDGGTGVNLDAGVSSSYLDMSGWTGELYEDTVQVGGQTPVVDLAFAEITSAEFFDSQGCFNPNDADFEQGIIGMGPADLEVPGTQAYFQQLTQANSSMSSIFAVQLCVLNGNLWLGGYDPGFTDGSTPLYTPLAASQSYSVTLGGVHFASDNLGWDPLAVNGYNPSTLDTGTSQFWLPHDAYVRLVTDLESNEAVQAAFPQADDTFWGGNACDYPVSAVQHRLDLDAVLPPLVLSFGQADGGSFDLTIPATRSYLMPYYDDMPDNNEGYSGLADPLYCNGIVDSDPSDSGDSFTIIGANILSAYITIFDLAHSQVGFVPGVGCP